MARTAKKEQNLTIDEKLDQALVPDVEQPFHVPQKWKWCYLRAFSDIKTGKKDANYGSANGKYFFFTCASEPIRCDGYSFEGKAILLAGNGDISNISLYEGKFEAYQRTYVLNIVPPLSTEFFYYYFKYRWVDYNINKIFGTAIPYIRLGNLQDFPVPLPPLAEQQRIVDRIESLFAKLDEAKEKAQAVIDGFEDRKAAILHKAFTGELTAEWRDTNHVDFATWKEMPLGNAITAVKDKYDPEKAHLLDVSYIGLEHLEKGNGITGKGNATDVKSLKTLFLKGDILYGKLRPYLDKHDVAPFDGMCSTDILVYRAERNNSAYFFNYLMSQPNFIRYANSTAKGINLPRTSEKEISAYKIKLPLPEEQEKIVQMVDVLLGAEKQAKEAAEQVIDQIYAMKKAILARAFRGELGTNDTNDEPAIELLKRVLNDSQSNDDLFKPARKRTTIPKEIDEKLSTGMERDIIKLFIKADNNSVSMDTIMAVSSKKFEILDTLRALEKKGLIQKIDVENYSLVE